MQAITMRDDKRFFIGATGIERKMTCMAAITCAILAVSMAASAEGYVNNASAAQAGSSGDSCNLQKTPLARCDIFNDYMQADQELNVQYRALAKKLDAKLHGSLRTTQREWIKFRERKCEEVQIASGCDNGLCDGVAHDDCILELTQIRTKQLGTMATKAGTSSVSDFSFEKVYPKPPPY